MSPRAAPTVAIIVPVLIEPEIDRQLERLTALSPDELIVAEAGDAATGERLRAFIAARASAANIRVVRSERGRARQRTPVRAPRVAMFYFSCTPIPCCRRAH